MTKKSSVINHDLVNLMYQKIEETEHDDNAYIKGMWIFTDFENCYAWDCYHNLYSRWIPKYSQMSIK